MNKTEITSKIKEKAIELGFCRVGIAKAEALNEEKIVLEKWLQQEKHGKMRYMENHFEKRVDPRKLVPGAKSVISVAMNYYTPHQHQEDIEKGKISRYAWGDDYHDVLKERLKLLMQYMQEQDPKIIGRSFVDSAPVMDKAWAVRSGIGWLGKHSNIINREYGSWIFLGEAIVNCELDYDSPMPDYCGSCTKCIDACPTDAITPYNVDGSKCIAYLTIELKPEFEIPQQLQPKTQNWIFGCDICQDVCPWNNKFSQPTPEQRFEPRPDSVSPDLKQLAQIDEDQFRKRFRKSPIKRTKWAGLMRNIKAAMTKKKSD